MSASIFALVESKERERERECVYGNIGLYGYGAVLLLGSVSLDVWGHKAILL